MRFLLVVLTLLWIHGRVDSYKFNYTCQGKLKITCHDQPIILISVMSVTRAEWPCGLTGSGDRDTRKEENIWRKCDGKVTCTIKSGMKLDDYKYLGVYYDCGRSIDMCSPVSFQTNKAYLVSPYYRKEFHYDSSTICRCEAPLTKPARIVVGIQYKQFTSLDTHLMIQWREDEIMQVYEETDISPGIIYRKYANDTFKLMFNANGRDGSGFFQLFYKASIPLSMSCNVELTTTSADSTPSQVDTPNQTISSKAAVPPSPTVTSAQETTTSQIKPTTESLFSKSTSEITRTEPNSSLPTPHTPSGTSYILQESSKVPLAKSSTPILSTQAPSSSFSSSKSVQLVVTSTQHLLTSSTQTQSVPDSTSKSLQSNFTSSVRPTKVTKVKEGYRVVTTEDLTSRKAGENVTEIPRIAKVHHNETNVLDVLLPALIAVSSLVLLTACSALVAALACRRRKRRHNYDANCSDDHAVSRSVYELEHPVPGEEEASQCEDEALVGATSIGDLENDIPKIDAGSPDSLKKEFLAEGEEDIGSCESLIMHDNILYEGCEYMDGQSPEIKKRSQPNVSAPKMDDIYATVEKGDRLTPSPGVKQKFENGAVKKAESNTSPNLKLKNDEFDSGTISDVQKSASARTDTEKTGSMRPRNGHVIVRSNGDGPDGSSLEREDANAGSVELSTLQPKTEVTSNPAAPEPDYEPIGPFSDDEFNETDCLLDESGGKNEQNSIRAETASNDYASLERNIAAHKNDSHIYEIV